MALPARELARTVAPHLLAFAFPCYAFACLMSGPREGRSALCYLDWDDLEGVTDGSAAAAAWALLARGALEAADATRTREALLAYCARDTLAMVELHRALREL